MPWGTAAPFSQTLLEMAWVYVISGDETGGDGDPIWEYWVHAASRSEAKRILIHELGGHD